MIRADPVGTRLASPLKLLIGLRGLRVGVVFSSVVCGGCSSPSGGGCSAVVTRCLLPGFTARETGGRTSCHCQAGACLTVLTSPPGVGESTGIACDYGRIVEMWRRSIATSRCGGSPPPARSRRRRPGRPAARRRNAEKIAPIAGRLPRVPRAARGYATRAGRRRTVFVIAARAGQASDAHYAALAAPARSLSCVTAFKLERRPEPEPQRQPSARHDDRQRAVRLHRITLPPHGRPDADAAVGRSSRCADRPLASLSRLTLAGAHEPRLPRCRARRSVHARLEAELGRDTARRPGGQQTTVVVASRRRPGASSRRCNWVRWSRRQTPKPDSFGNCVCVRTRPGSRPVAGGLTRLISRGLRRAHEDRHLMWRCPAVVPPAFSTPITSRHWEDGGPTELAKLVLVMPQSTHRPVTSAGVITDSGLLDALTVSRRHAGRLTEAGSWEAADQPVRWQPQRHLRRPSAGGFGGAGQ